MTTQIPALWDDDEQALRDMALRKGLDELEEATRKWYEYNTRPPHRFHLERDDFTAPLLILGIAVLFGLGCLASQFVGRDAFGLLAVVLLVAAAFVGLRLMGGRRK